MTVNSLPTLDQIQELHGKEPPPPGQAGRPLTEDERAQVRRKQRRRRKVLDTKNHSEARAKYVLSHLFNATGVEKDADRRQLGGGRRFPVKKVADLRGSISLRYNGSVTTRPLFAEVKGIAPGNSFYIARLDRQRRKMDARSDAVRLIFLVRWFSKENTQRLPEGWPLDGVTPVQYAVGWKRWWGQTVPALQKRASGNFKGRSVRTQDWDLLKDCRIYKESGQWRFCRDHWALDYLPEKSTIPELDI